MWDPFWVLYVVTLSSVCATEIDMSVLFGSWEYLKTADASDLGYSDSPVPHLSKHAHSLKLRVVVNTDFQSGAQLCDSVIKLAAFLHLGLYFQGLSGCVRCVAPHDLSHRGTTGKATAPGGWVFPAGFSPFTRSCGWNVPGVPIVPQTTSAGGLSKQPTTQFYGGAV